MEESLTANPENGSVLLATSITSLDVIAAFVAERTNHTVGTIVMIDVAIVDGPVIGMTDAEEEAMKTVVVVEDTTTVAVEEAEVDTTADGMIEAEPEVMMTVEAEAARSRGRR